MCETQFKKIAYYIRRKRVALFLGAGFSIKAGAPRVSALKKCLLDGLTSEEKQDLTNNSSLQSISQRYITFKSRNLLIECLAKCFNFIPLDLTDHNDLTQIPQIKTIFTTNYDTLIENTYNGKCNIIVDNSDLADINSKLPTIYKVHGDFKHPDKIVISEDDYIEFYSKNGHNVYWQEICSQLAKYHIVFMGYSYSDPNIKYIMDFVVSQVGKRQKKIYLIAPDMKSYEVKQLEQKGIVYLNAKAEDLFAYLKPEIHNSIADDYRNHTATAEDCSAIMSLYDLQPTIQPQSDDVPNKILDVKSKSGEPITHSLKITMPYNGGKNPLSDIPTKFNRFGIPYKKINYISFEHRLNGLKFETEKDITNVFFMPLVKELKYIIKVPKKDIVCRGICHTYKDTDKDKAVMVFDIDVGLLHIYWGKTVQEPTTFCITYSQEYKNNENAIIATEILLSYLQQESVQLIVYDEKDKNSKLDCTFDKQFAKDDEIKVCKDRLLYYQYIKKIEEQSDLPFEIYQNYTPQNMWSASCLYHFITEEELSVKNNPKEKTEYTISVNSHIPEKGQTYLSIEEYSNIPIKLNNKDFIIPYVIKQRNACRFTNKKRVAEGWKFTMTDQAETYTMFFRREPFLPIKEKQ